MQPVESAETIPVLISSRNDEYMLSLQSPQRVHQQIMRDFMDINDKDMPLSGLNNLL